MQSWRRCVEQYGLDPARPSPAHIVTETRLREHREQAERLIAIARSGLEALFRQIVGQNYVLMLADAQGVTVDYFGDPRFEEDLRRAGLYLGADWSEDLAGTCGIGSCLVAGEPVTIHQTDHFDLMHTRLSCTAAPIFDASGVLAAVLDISLLRSPQPKISQSLAMNLVRTSARRIEMANLMAMTRGDWVLRFSTMPEFLDVDPEAAVALDGTGHIIGLTRGAQQALAPDGGPVLGERLDSLMELSVDDLPELMRGRPTEDRLIRLRDGQAMFGHAIAPQRGPLPRSAPAPELPAALRNFGGEDPAIRRLLVQAARLAPTGIPLLIRGETGTGKERLARAIHDCQPGSRPFVTVNCAALSGADRTLLAETADGLRLVEGARGGTLVFDNLGDLPPELQGRLLRLLSEVETQAFGSGSAGRVRLISTTRQDLAEAVEQGRFREDLFFRLAGATLTVAPLRLRQDFDWLLDRLLRQRTHGRADSYRLSPAARAQLKSRPWPGNVRELMNLLDVAVALAEAPVIDLPDLPPAPMPEGHAGPATEESLEAILAACGWNMSCAARRLGVDRSTILRRARRLGLVQPPRR
ncbi:sigma-54-dependent Fis family transcriptional regulator [Rubellimicrobium roseum]|uniref:Sigma-54-dependent Fis family transcriptional regulator n=2 Tax=Rubellimicrobium roseum TaxID=687525 RepID=A0A5C4NLG7_9RHOB|nr:sigma-54-dependent Fis family transcriptional regulator [Rubellimicrobium roseum]